MAKFAAISLADVETTSSYALGRKVSGVRSSKRISPDDYSLFLVVSELDDGAVVEWDTAHGDEALCVLEGELDVDGHRCPPGGAVVVENVFAWNGVGRLAVQAILQRDFPLIQGFVLMFATIVIAVTLVVDILYAVVDPRIRYES